MDLKTAPKAYGPPLCPENASPAVLRSIGAIMSSGVEYEFRTTCVRPFVTEARMRSMAIAVQGARRLVLQRFNPQKTLDPGYGEASQAGLSIEQMRSLQQLAAPFVESCSIR
jgi:pyruvate formate lyase activating enzyme